MHPRPLQGRLRGVLMLIGRQRCGEESVTALYRHHFPAMGTEFSLCLRRQPEHRLLDFVHAEVERLESVFSTYREDSEISRLNDGRLSSSSRSTDVADAFAWRAEAE